jgi:hypothetical protein
MKKRKKENCIKDMSQTSASFQKEAEASSLSGSGFDKCSIGTVIEKLQDRDSGARRASNMEPVSAPNTESLTLTGPIPGLLLGPGTRTSALLHSRHLS